MTKLYISLSTVLFSFSVGAQTPPPTPVSVPAPAPAPAPSMKNLIKSDIFKAPKTNGHRLNVVDEGSLYEKIGLKSGDVVKSYNGKAINSPPEAMGFYNYVRTSKKVDLVIERDGKIENIHYVLSP